jgi:hypothetical protein
MMKSIARLTASLCFSPLSLSLERNEMPSLTIERGPA